MYSVGVKRIDWFHVPVLQPTLWMWFKENKKKVLKSISNAGVDQNWSFNSQSCSWRLCNRISCQNILLTSFKYWERKNNEMRKMSSNKCRVNILWFGGSFQAIMKSVVYVIVFDDSDRSRIEKQHSIMVVYD